MRRQPGALPAFTVHKDTSNKLLLVIAKVAVSKRKQVWGLSVGNICLVYASPSG